MCVQVTDLSLVPGARLGSDTAPAPAAATTAAALPAEAGGIDAATAAAAMPMAGQQVGQCTHSLEIAHHLCTCNGSMRLCSTY